MAKRITKIVLTGGPAAGKTTLVSRVLKEFKQDDGWKVITIPETATELISGFGIRPFGNCVSMLDFQYFVIADQLHKEKLALKGAQMVPEENVLIIYDRALFDDKAYITDEQEILVPDLLLRRPADRGVDRAQARRRTIWPNSSSFPHCCPTWRSCSAACGAGRLPEGIRPEPMMLLILGHFYENCNTIYCDIHLEYGEFCGIVKKVLFSEPYSAGVFQMIPAHT